MSGELIGVLIAVLAVGVTFGRSDPDQQSRPAAARTAGWTLDDAVRTHHRGLHGARETVARALTQLWQQQQRARERPRGPERDFGPRR